METSLSTGEASLASHSLCKLLVSLGDHSVSYLATNIASSMPISTGPTTLPTTKGHLIQDVLQLLLSYTALPGYLVSYKLDAGLNESRQVRPVAKLARTAPNADPL